MRLDLQSDHSVSGMSHGETRSSKMSNGETPASWVIDQ